MAKDAIRKGSLTKEGAKKAVKNRDKWKSSPAKAYKKSPAKAMKDDKGAKKRTTLGIARDVHSSTTKKTKELLKSKDAKNLTPAQKKMLEKFTKKSPAKKKGGLMEKLIPSASTRDKIKGVGKKISDAYTYTKGVAKEIHRAKRPGERYYPLEAGERALRAKRRGVDVKSAQAIRGDANRPLKPSNLDKYGRKKTSKTGRVIVPKTAQGKADAIAAMRKRNARDKAVKNKK